MRTIQDSGQHVNKGLSGFIQVNHSTLRNR